MSTIVARRRARRISPAELDAIILPARHNGGPSLDDVAPPRIYRPVTPALIIPRTVLRYRGIWNGADDFHGRLLVEGRAGHREWVDLQSLFDGGWDGQPPTTAMLSRNACLWMAAGRIVVPSSQTFTASGSLLIRLYNRFEGVVVGAGAGAGGAYGGGTDASGSNGVGSSFASATPLVANGGIGGVRGRAGNSAGAGGAGGTASGGTTNSTGTAGSNADAPSTISGAGGTRASYVGTLITYTQRSGGAARSTEANGASGANGGGGGSGANYTDTRWGGGGGAGALAARLWARGDAGSPAVGDLIAIVIGGAAAGDNTSDFDGGDGGRGEGQFAWD